MAENLETGAAEQPARIYHFLVIEDSLSIRHFLKRTLESSFPGCVVHEADEGKKGLHEMGQNRINALISDLEMPGMDGRSFLRLISSNPILRRKPVVVLSSAITEDLVKEFENKLSIRFLRKPALPADISEALRGLVAV